MTDAGSNEIIRLDSSHRQMAIETLSRAFRDNLPLTYYFPEAAEREIITRYFMSLAVYSGLRYGEVYATSPSMEGVAVWAPSDNLPIDIWKALRSVPLHIIIGFARSGGNRMNGLGQHIENVHRRLAHFKHMYLQAIGIAPAFQGKGYAGKLLKHMSASLDSIGMPCYLDTLDEKNVRIYEHFGFTVADESTVPGTTLTSWAMVREPRKTNTP